MDSQVPDAQRKSIINSSLIPAPRPAFQALDAVRLVPGVQEPADPRHPRHARGRALCEQPQGELIVIPDAHEDARFANNLEVS